MNDESLYKATSQQNIKYCHRFLYLAGSFPPGSFPPHRSRDGGFGAHVYRLPGIGRHTNDTDEPDEVEYSASSHCHGQLSAYAFDNSLEIFVNQLYKVAISRDVHWQRSEKNDRLHGSKELEDRLEL